MSNRNKKGKDFSVYQDVRSGITHFLLLLAFKRFSVNNLQSKHQLFCVLKFFLRDDLGDDQLSFLV